MKKEILMTPGPSQVPPLVALAEASPIMHHRSPEFKEIFVRIHEGLRQIFGTSGDVFTLASSGTGAMESAVVNSLCPGDRVIVCNTGKFGERFTKICQTYGVEVHEIVKEWGQIVTPAEIEAALKNEKDVRAVFVQHNETSSGVSHNIAEIGAVLKKHPDTLFVVDAISALGGLEMRMDDWGVDFVAAGSQKALMLPPGLAFIGVSAKAWKAYERSTLPKFYFDLKKYKKTLDKGESPFTVPVSLCVALDVALKMILDEGLDNVYARHARLAEACRAGVAAIGLELFTENHSNVLSVFKVPEGVDGKKLVKTIRERLGLRVSGGQEPYEGKIIRIAHMGYVTEQDILLSLAGVEMALATMGHNVVPGAGVKAAEEVFLK